MTKRSVIFGGLTGLAAALVLMLGAMAVRAAEPVFPVGSLIGLVPPPGMEPAKAFAGFENPGQHAIMIVSTLPAPAYAELSQPNAIEVLKKQGIEIKKREPIELAIGNGVLLEGTQLAPDKTKYRKWLLVVDAHQLTGLINVQVPENNSTYSEAVVRAALATIAVRRSVPSAELLSLLPFTVKDLSGYQIENVIPGRAILLIDGSKTPHMVVTNGVPQYMLDARLMIAALPGGPTAKSDQPDFARLAFSSISGIKDIQFTMSESVRLDNQEAFETVAHAKDARTGSDLMVVQWLRFGNGGFIQIVGISRAALWADELPRMRALRDSVGLK